MRTLAATFSTRDEAEAASRRLEAIGISPERITQKEVETTGPAASAGTIFMSVKVTTDQVQAANEILKEHPVDAPLAAASSQAPVEETAPPPLVEPVAPSRSASASPVESGPTARPATQQRQQQQQPSPRVAAGEGWSDLYGGDSGRLGRYLLLLLFVLALAFLLGAGIGLLT